MPDRTPLDRIEKALPDLSPGEKANLLQKVARELAGALPGHYGGAHASGGAARIGPPPGHARRRTP